MSAPDFEALLAKHLNDGCSDARCGFVLHPREGWAHFGPGFIAHLAAEIRREVSEWLASEELRQAAFATWEGVNEGSYVAGRIEAVLALVAEEVKGL